SWVFDASIACDEIDKKFYDAIPSIKDGYIKMYPYITFKGDLNCKEIVENMYKIDKSVVMFRAESTRSIHYQSIIMISLIY
ncbi:MAG: hypothetical protein IJJ60_03170, partial [Clostridia bacterium]|nr:hypothetical protein [Clostridia bacterium]